MNENRIEPYTLLYDGSCPFCKVEISNLRRVDNKRMDSRGELGFIDISKAGFDASKYGVAQEDLMSRIHAVKADGGLETGMDVIRQAYSSVGLSRWVSWTGLPGIARVFDGLYTGFARYRIPLGNIVLRCQKTCSRPTKQRRYYER